MEPSTVALRKIQGTPSVSEKPGNCPLKMKCTECRRASKAVIRTDSLGSDALLNDFPALAYGWRNRAGVVPDRRYLAFVDRPAGSRCG
jgi:hypothetical protein